MKIECSRQLCAKRTDRQTDRRTDRQSDTLSSCRSQKWFRLLQALSQKSGILGKISCQISTTIHTTIKLTTSGVPPFIVLDQLLAILFLEE